MHRPRLLPVASNEQPDLWRSHLLQVSTRYWQTFYIATELAVLELLVHIFSQFNQPWLVVLSEFRKLLSNCERLSCGSKHDIIGSLNPSSLLFVTAPVPLSAAHSTSVGTDRDEADAFED